MRCLANLVLVALCLRQDCSVHAFRQSAAKSHSTRSIALSTRSLALSTALQYDNASVNAAVDDPSSSDYGDTLLRWLDWWVRDTPTVDISPLDFGREVVKCGNYTINAAKSTKDVAVKTMELFTLMHRFWQSLLGMNKFLDKMSPKIENLVDYLQQPNMTWGGRYVALDVVVELASKGRPVYNSLDLAHKAYKCVQAIVEKILGAKPPQQPPPPPAPLSVQLQEADEAGRKAQGVFTRVQKIVKGLGIGQLESHFNDLSGQFEDLAEALKRLRIIQKKIERKTLLEQAGLVMAAVASTFHGNFSFHHPQGILMDEVYQVSLRMLRTSNKVLEWYLDWKRKWWDLEARFKRQIDNIRHLFKNIGVSACDASAELFGCLLIT